MRITQPLNGYVLIRPRKSAPAPAGIEIPDSVDKEKATVGEVMMQVVVLVTTKEMPVGHQVTARLEKGESVLFSSLSPRKVTHDGEECLLIHGEDVLAVIEE